MCRTHAFCEEKPGAFSAHLIRFGVIEPPVVAQQDITVRAATSNQQKDVKPLECSGLAWLPNHLLISSDRHEHLLFTCSVDLEKMTIGTPEPHIVVQNEQYLLDDIESLRVLEQDGQISLYMMCSLSNDPDAQPLPQRRHLFRGHVNQVSPIELDQSTVVSAGTIRRQLETCLETIKAPPYYTYHAAYVGEDKNTYRWGNVEGITFTPNGQQLLCGMRNPLFDNAAILFVVSGIYPAPELLQAESFRVTDFFLLDVEDRGISDIFWDPVTQGYLITAAKSNGPRLDPDHPFPPNTLDSALFWWSGHKQDGPILIARITDMTIEAVCRLGSSRYIALGSDEGDVSEGRTARQSIITIVEFTGISQGSD
jgi:hypothetical protein